MRRLLLACLFLSLLSPSLKLAADVKALQDTQTKEQKDARMAWWRAARFGMFIHWGIYSLPGYPKGPLKQKPVGGGGEWIMCFGKIPVKDYEAQGPLFNPTDFNADDWVKLAKDAGMKYMVITAKHHDGFAMFKTAADPFNIYDATPFKRDPLKELSIAAAKQGIKLGFYYSQNQDWTAKGGAANLGHWDHAAQDGDFATYFNNKVVPQLNELLTNYQPAPAVIWFDTPGGALTHDLASKIVALLNQHPEVIWNNRLGGGYNGDTEVEEGTIPGAGLPGRDWETCMTLNNGWAYDATDTNYKSTETLLHNLIDIASKGGNYLLNVGPTPMGVIPAGEADRLREIGKWLAVNGESIYGTQTGPFIQPLPWGRATQKPGKLFCHVFDWPKDGKLLIPISNQVTKAYLLSNPNTPLATTVSPDGVIVQGPATAPDPIASVIALEITGPAAPVLQAIDQASDGKINLTASTAIVVGTGGLNIQDDNKMQDLGHWGNSSDYPHWLVQVSKPGTFKVQVTYSLQSGPRGSKLVLTAQDQTLTVPLPGTKDWNTFVPLDAGTITIGQPGRVDFAVKGTTVDGAGGICNLKGLVLTPAP